MKPTFLAITIHKVWSSKVHDFSLNPEQVSMRSSCGWTRDIFMKAEEGSVNIGNDPVELTPSSHTPVEVRSTVEAIMHLPSSAGRKDAAYRARQVMVTPRRGIRVYDYPLCFAGTQHADFFSDANIDSWVVPHLCWHLAKFQHVSTKNEHLRRVWLKWLRPEHPNLNKNIAEQDFFGLNSWKPFLHENSYVSISFTSNSITKQACMHELCNPFLIAQSEIFGKYVQNVDLSNLRWYLVKEILCTSINYHAISTDALRKAHGSWL